MTSIKLKCLMGILCIHVQVFGQQILSGRVVGRDGEPIEGATAKLLIAGREVATGKNGAFAIYHQLPSDSLLISLMGYNTFSKPISADLADIGVIVLESSSTFLQEVVVNTGYYEVPIEKTTGAFSQIDNALFNRTVSVDFLSRLEGIVPGLQFQNTYSGEAFRAPNLRVRGTGTILSSESPLIVIDNFPFDGDPQTLNPNDIESVTILKDAAAASIWGARAGNGVIVITTKKGTEEEKRLSFNSNLSVLKAPDLFYDRSFVPSPDWMEFEKERYESGAYRERNNVLIPPYVEMLIAERDGMISAEELANYEETIRSRDIRRDALKYLYRPGINQQYSLNIQGGSKAHWYYISVGHDVNSRNTKGDDYNRTTFSVRNSFEFSQRFSTSLAAYYTSQNIRENGLNMLDISSASIGLVPYSSLLDDDGNPAEVPHTYRLAYVGSAETSGLLPWHYKPLEEMELSDRKNVNATIRLDLETSMRINPVFDLIFQYQYSKGSTLYRTKHDKQSYYVRNLVNRFTQDDGRMIIPYGNILIENQSFQDHHTGRLQTNVKKDWGKHEFRGLAGVEARQVAAKQSPGYQLFDFNEDNLSGTAQFDYNISYIVRPSGGARIPAPPSIMGETIDRYLSYYANSVYSFDERYLISASLRWDGSNLFGVKSNQKGVPLWSTGFSWDLSKEPFWGSEQLVSNLRIRATYGVNGNVNKTVTAYPIMTYASDFFTGFPTAVLRSAGNPSLKWEQVRTWNIGADATIMKGKLHSRLDYFVKKGRDLIGERFMDPTTGISGVEISNLVNYANIVTKGIDLESTIHVGKADFSWSGTLLLGWTRNKITAYENKETASVYDYVGGSPLPVVGESKDALYAIPWYGLDGSSGQPMVPNGGELGVDYANYLSAITWADLQNVGVTVPVLETYFRSALSWKSYSVSVNMGYKGGYVFRRSSIDYGDMFNQGLGHGDYLNRWQNAGDELSTNVPAKPKDINRNRDDVYTLSEVLIEKGDHIRIKDIQLAYSLGNFSFYTFINNVGLIWRANRSSLDPDFKNAKYPTSRSVSIGFRLNF